LGPRPAPLAKLKIHDHQKSRALIQRDAGTKKGIRTEKAQGNATGNSRAQGNFELAWEQLSKKSRGGGEKKEKIVTVARH